MKNFEKKILLKSFKSQEETNKLHGDSSGFESDDHQEYFANIRKQHEENETTFTEREIKLIAGIQTKQDEINSLMRSKFTEAFKNNLTNTLLKMKTSIKSDDDDGNSGAIIRT